MSNVAKNFDISTTSLNILHNYFESLFSDLYLAKFLDTSNYLSCRQKILREIEEIDFKKKIM